MASYGATDSQDTAPETTDAEELPEETGPKVKLPSLTTRIDWVDDWEELTRDNRKLARQDRDYYDGKQWSKEDLERLKERGQPPLVKNRIARKINFILGEEIKKRIDPSARPRTPQHEDSARTATDALRYVEEEQKLDQVRSAVLKNMLVEGMGGALKQLDSDNDYKHELIHVEYDRLGYDPHSRAPDVSDAKYKFIVRWADYDDAVADYPDCADELRSAINEDGYSGDDTTEDVPRRWGDKRRDRVKIIEMYFRVGADWYRSDFIKNKDLRKVERTAYLDEKKKHSVCPLVMASCYVDAEGNRYGVVRQLISPQDEINKRASKQLHLLSVKQVLAERDFIRDPNKFQTELAKPDGFLEVEPGGLEEGRVQIVQNAELSAGQAQMGAQAMQDIDSIGPSSATLSELPQAASGRAFVARQQAASQELGPVFDSLRNWTMAVYELDWLCIRGYWTEEKWLRVTDDQELTGYRFTSINQQMPRIQRLQELMQKGAPLESALQSAAGDMAPVVFAQAQQMAQQQAQMAQMQAQSMGGQMGPPAPGQAPQGPPQAQPDPQQAILAALGAHPLMQEPMTLNQVDQMLVDIVLDEAPDTAVLAQEEFATLSELLPTVAQGSPNMAPQMVKLLVRASQLPNKRELLQEMDKGPDPQQMQAQQQIQQLQTALADANVKLTQAKATHEAASAQKKQVETSLLGPQAQADIEAKQAQSMNHAASAGAKAGGAPQMQTQGVM